MDQSNDELTRRQWLLRLGEAVALMGFSGVASEAEPAAGSAPGLAGVGSGVSALPPGLYDASTDHLAHVLSNRYFVSPIPRGTETDYRQPREDPFQPQFFSTVDFEVVQRIVELILGEAQGMSKFAGEEKGGAESVSAEIVEWIDQTVFHAPAVRDAARRLAPEHRVLAIHYYGLSAVEKVEEDDPQKTCREGLDWLTGESSQRYGRSFLSLGEPEQVELLRSVGDERPDKTLQNGATRFFEWLKAEIIRGFYTSRVGLKELDYKGNAFYVGCPGCEEDGHSKRKL